MIENDEKSTNCRKYADAADLGEQISWISVKPFLVPVGKNRHSVDDSAIMASIVIICCQFVVGNGCVVK